jgi:hypothetical protein
MMKKMLIVAIHPPGRDHQLDQPGRADHQMDQLGRVVDHQLDRVLQQLEYHQQLSHQVDGHSGIGFVSLNMLDPKDGLILTVNLFSFYLNVSL